MDKESFKYLKDESHYNDFYDRFTIKECRRWENKRDFDSLPSIKNKKPKEAKIRKNYAIKIVIPTALYFIKGERYAKKSETIREWMNRDQAKDDKVTNAVEPIGICCPECGVSMKCISRDLMTDARDKEQVLFLFECPIKGHRRSAYWENGETWKPRPYPCSKCQAGMKSSHVYKNNKVITTYTCQGCGHKETNTLDLKVEKEKIDPNFESDRKKYCLSEEEGEKYVSWAANLKELAEIMKDREENKEAYEAVSKIKKLKINDLEKLLSSQLKKNGYIKLKFNDPEIAKDVIVGFSVRDTKSEREEHDSRNELKRLIKKTLGNTNWRLMSEGINYRLGILTGRLRGYEGEEDLLKLIKK